MEGLEAAAKVAKKAAEAGQFPPEELIIDGIAVPWDRVRRHFGRDPRYACEFLGGSRKIKGSQTKALLKACDLDHATEILLVKVQEFYPTRIHQPRHGPPANDDPAGTVLQYFVGGIALVNRHQLRDGWRSIKLACYKANDIFQEERIGLLPCLFYLFSQSVWRRHSELYRIVISHFTSLSSKFLGTCHPITVILDTIRKAGSFNFPTEVLIRALLDIIKQSKTHVLEPRDLHHLDLLMFTVYEKTHSLADSQSMAEDLVAKRQRISGIHNVDTLVAVGNLAEVYKRRWLKDQNEELKHKAEALLLEIVQHARKTRVEGAPLRLLATYMGAARQLGALYFRQGEFAKSEMYYLQVQFWAETELGPLDPDIYISRKDVQALQLLREKGFFEPLPADWRERAGDKEESRFVEVTDEEESIVTSEENQQVTTWEATATIRSTAVLETFSDIDGGHQSVQPQQSEIAVAMEDIVWHGDYLSPPNAMH